MQKISCFRQWSAVAVIVAGVAYNRSGRTAILASGAGGGRGGGRGGRGGRPPMPVEFTTAKRGAVSEQILVVGNLIGAATVQVVPTRERTTPDRRRASSATPCVTVR